MGFLKLISNIGLILAITTVFCNTDDSEISYRLLNNAKPLSYNISLIPHLEKGNFHGKISVIIMILHASSKISLHSQELKIRKTATTLINYHGTMFKPKEHTYNNVTNILVLKFDEILSNGLYILNMKFAGNFSASDSKKNGFMKISYTVNGENSTLAATHFEPNNARRMFPCWDEPALKATFNISVMHHQKYRVLSNMPIRKQFEKQDGMMWTHFNTTPIMSTYLVGIVIVSNFIRIANANETINVWCTSHLESQAKFAHNVAKKITPLLIEYTNRSEVIPKMDHVMINNYPVMGMENWGLIIYNESYVIYDDNIHPPFQRRKLASLVAHEIVHQWFGNLVTPSWWSYLWLNEGFAVFFQAYFLNKIFADWRTMDFFVIQHLHYSLALDVGLYDPITLKFGHNISFYYGDLFIDEIYEKAPVILRMLQHAITDEVFQKAVITYLAKSQFGSVTPDDLWNAIQTALEEATHIPYMNENFKIKEVMDTWFHRSQYPMLNVMRDYRTGAVEITQICFAINCINSTWWIPITFTTQLNPDFNNTMPYQWLGPNEIISINISPHHWIIVNLQQTAYCRVYYDITNWQQIIRHLTSEKYMDIHVLNRAQIIDDAFVFLQNDLIDSSLFINIISYLSREKDYIAWYPMFQILIKLSKYFPLPESKDFKLHMIGIFDELFYNIGYEDNSNDNDITKILRLEATNWACTIGHTECKRLAAVKLSEHLIDPNTHKIPQWWQDRAYCIGLKVANRTTWDKMLELYHRKPDKRFWKILSCAENPHIIVNYLNIIASNTTFRDEEHPLIFKIILKKHARNNLILSYILQNFELIKPRSMTRSLMIKYILQNVFSIEQVDKVLLYSEIFLSDVSLLYIKNQVNKRKVLLKHGIQRFTKLFGKIKLN